MATVAYDSQSLVQWQMMQGMNRSALTSDSVEVLQNFSVVIYPDAIFLPPLVIQVEFGKRQLITAVFQKLLVRQ